MKHRNPARQEVIYERKRHLRVGPSFETHARSRAHAPQRLCCLSSVPPRRFVPDHSVDDDEEFAGNRNERDHFWLSGR